MISEVLKSNKTLTTLTLNGDEKERSNNYIIRRKIIKMKRKVGNAFGDEGAKTIGELLKSNSILTSLNLGSDRKVEEIIKK